MNLKIDSYWELLALHKSMMAVKFDPNSCLHEAQGSPFTGSLAFKVFDLLVESCLEDGKEKAAEDWLKWQVADVQRTETQLLRKHVSESSWWADADNEKRSAYVKDFMAPLKLEPDVARDIVEHC